MPGVKWRRRRPGLHTKVGRGIGEVERMPSGKWRWFAWREGDPSPDGGQCDDLAIGQRLCVGVLRRGPRPTYD